MRKEHQVGLPYYLWKEHGFDLNKNEFRDVIALRYNRNVSNLPPKCLSGNSFDLNHAMNRKKEFLLV